MLLDGGGGLVFGKMEQWANRNAMQRLRQRGHGATNRTRETGKFFAGNRLGDNVVQVRPGLQELVMDVRKSHTCLTDCRPMKGFPGIYGQACHSSAGITMIELMIAVAIIGTLAAIAVPTYGGFVDKARLARAISDINQISKEIIAYRIDKDSLPSSLDDIGYGSLLDPWNHLYQYLNIETVKGNGGVRKDKNLVPLNSDFDLYSMGKDGASMPPLTSEVSKDDIIRANDGSYIGLASSY